MIRAALLVLAAAVSAIPTKKSLPSDYPAQFEWLSPSHAKPRGSVAHLSKDAFKIDHLPGLEETLDFPMYSGYMPSTEGTELFFWFVEARKNPDAPVLLWVNGGPGASSVAYGFWTEHGPFRLVGNSSKVERYPYSWNERASILYLEAPSGVGFSHSLNESHYQTGDAQTAEDNLNFLLNFFTVFAEYKSRDLYLTGESYGGHYVPTLAAMLLSRDNDLNMKGFFIGNPGIENDWYYNTNEYAFLTFMWSNAMIPQDAYLDAYNACGWGKFLEDCAGDYDHPDQKCQDAAARAWNYVPKTWDPYNVLTGTCKQKQTGGDAFVASYTPWLARAREMRNANVEYNPCINEWTPVYMNRPEVIKAIHADKYYSRHWPGTPAVWKYGDETLHITKLFPFFLEHAPQWNIMVASGTADAAVPFVGTQRWISCLHRPVISDWKDWELDGDVAGTVKKYQGVTLLTVKGCGHTIPTYCPKAGLAMLDMYFENGK